MIFKKKHLHIVRDEKFIDAAYRVFEEVRPGENEYIVLGKKRKPVYIKHAKVKFCRPTVIWLLRKILDLKYRSLIIHGLSNNFLMLLVSSVSKRIPIFWIGWGHDYYGFSKINLYKKQTQIIVDEFKLNELNIINNYFIKELDHEINMTNVFERINFFGPVLGLEFKFVKEFHPKSNIEFLDWNYLTLEEDIINGFEGRVITGNNLMLGNSANPVNNQLDAFEDILDFNFIFGDIICPLSYGNGKYRHQVITKGKLFFSDRFKPITTFLNYSDYVVEIMSCKYFFINSNRQVAMGNILLMLYLGAYVIFDEINPAYRFFIENNIQVFSVEEAKRGDFQEIDVFHTRKKLVELWGHETIKEKTQIVYSKLEAALRNGI